jgi:uncharacterized membrane protein
LQDEKQKHFDGGNVMLRNFLLSLRTPLTLLAVGLLSVVANAQRSPSTAPSGLGMRRTEQASRTLSINSNAQTTAQSNLSVSFGLIDFPRTPGGTAFGLNSKGDVVGGYGPIPAAGYYETTGFTLKGNTFQTLAYPGAAVSAPYGINKRREIVGFYDMTGEGNFHGYLYGSSTFTNIDYPGAQATGALAINDSGEIVGTYIDSSNIQHGFTLIKGNYTAIDPPNSVGTIPYGVSSLGVVVGSYYDLNGFLHGFTFQNGQFTTVDYPGATNTTLSGINDQGQIVGSYGNGTVIAGIEWTTSNLFFLDQGTYTALALPVDDALVTWSFALSGSQFVGFYVDSLGNFFGYEAQVVTESH